MFQHLDDPKPLPASTGKEGSLTATAAGLSRLRGASLKL